MKKKSNIETKVFAGHYSSANPDPFFDEQPPREFIRDLKSPLHSEAPLNFGKKKSASAGEISVSGLFVKEKFPDDEGVLETAYDDFEKFLDICKIKGDRYPIVFEKGITPSFEAYRIIVTADSCRIVSADTEGARRAIFYLEGELIMRGGFGKTRRYLL